MQPCTTKPSLTFEEALAKGVKILFVSPGDRDWFPRQLAKHTNTEMYSEAWHYQLGGILQMPVWTSLESAIDLERIARVTKVSLICILNPEKLDRLPTCKAKVEIVTE
jgi:hypothetical protein